MITVLRLQRVRTGKTLRQFARENDLSEVVLCRIERGKQYISPAAREVLANALGMPVDQICDEHGWPRFDETGASGVPQGLGVD